MRKNKQEKVNRIQAEDLAAVELAASGTPTDLLLAKIFIRQGEMLQQLQEIQGNSWMR